MTKRDDPVRVAIIIGSIRTGRFGSTVGKWFAEYASARTDLETVEIDLIDYDLSHAFDETPSQISLCGRFASADAFVIVTPEYNHSFPGPLKTAIDCTDREFAGKPVAFVSYGGLSGGLRAVEALRVVMSEVHAVTIREVVSVHGGRSQFGKDGQPIAPERLEQSATRLLDQVVWWARAARSQQATSPYPG